MKFIEIKENFSVCKESIIAIEQTASSESYSGYKTIVHTKVGVFESSFPYKTLINLLDKEEEEQEEYEEDINNNNPQQFWRG